MNIIEKMKEIIMEYPHIDDFSSGVHIDYMDSEPNDFGLYSLGGEKIKTDILGNQTWRHRFVLYANSQSYTNFNTLANSSFLLNFSYWLSKKTNIRVEDNYIDIGSELLNEVDLPDGEGVNCPYTITKITPANGMLYSVPNDSTNDKVTYQLQMAVEYKIKFPKNF